MATDRTVAVVGAGIGGLSAAARLARAGYEVEVFEQNEVAGGKACEKRVSTPDGEFRWDCGPSLLTMPHFLEELFEECGEKLGDYLKLKPVSPTCRYFWQDGAVLDEDEEFWARPEVASYLDYARGVFQIGGDFHLRHAPGEWKRVLDPALWRSLKHLPKLASRKTMAQLHEQHFSDPHLRQLFDRFATYNGSDPSKTPSLFSIIPYTESQFGAWYPEGGMARIPEALVKLCVNLGVNLRFNRKIRELRRLNHRVVVCNGDIISACTHWLADAKRVIPLQKEDISCSAYILLLGVKKTFPKLAHHNIFFSGDYPAEFRDIFQHRKPASEPTLYVAITSRDQGADAPAGCENWFVMANAPANPMADFTGYAEVLLRRLGSMGVELKLSDIVCREVITPRDIRARDNSWEGSLYGWASHSLQTSMFRPPLRHPKWKNIFFVGGTTHPGGGIPLVLQSGAIVSQMVQHHYPAR